MNIEPCKKLIEALRSDKYIQGKRMLRNSAGNQFCVLGVACDVFNPDSWIWDNGFLYAFNGVRYRAFPPQAALNWLGINSYKANQLSIDNDRGITFAKLADQLAQELAA